MTNIILDTNILIRFPQILGLSFDDINLIITNSVIDELNPGDRQKNNIIDLIDLSVKNGNVQIVDSFSLLNKFQKK